MYVVEQMVQMELKKFREWLGNMITNDTPLMLVIYGSFPIFFYFVMR